MGEALEAFNTDDVITFFLMWVAYAFVFVNRNWLSLFIYCLFFAGAVVAYQVYFDATCSNVMTCAFGNLSSSIIITSGIAGIVARVLTLVLRYMTRARLRAAGKHENADVAGRKLVLIALFLGFPLWIFLMPIIL